MAVLMILVVLPGSVLALPQMLYLLTAAAAATLMPASPLLSLQRQGQWHYLHGMLPPGPAAAAVLVVAADSALAAVAAVASAATEALVVMFATSVRRAAVGADLASAPAVAAAVVEVTVVSPLVLLMLLDRCQMFPRSCHRLRQVALLVQSLGFLPRLDLSPLALQVLPPPTLPLA